MVAFVLSALPLVAILLLLTVVPFAQSDLTHLSFELPKILLIQLSGTVTLLLSLLFTSKKPKISKNFLYLALTITGISAVVSVLGLNSTQSFWGSYYRRTGIVTLFGTISAATALNILLNSRNQEKVKKALVAVIIFSSLIASGHAIYSFLAANFTNIPQLLSDGRIVTTFGHPNFLAGFLICTAPFYLINKRLRWLLALNLLAVALTFSRGAYFALFSGAYFWWLWQKNHRQKITIGAATLLAVVVIYITGFSLRMPFFYKHLDNYQLSRITVIFDPYKWGGEPRLKIYAKAIEAICKKPLLGYGIDNQNLAFTVVNAHEELHDILKGYALDRSHNEVLDILLQGGILLLLGYFFLVIKAVGNPDASGNTLALAAKTALVILLVRGLANVNSITQYCYFWLLVSLISSGPLEKTVDIKIKWWAKGGLALITILVSFFALKQYQADIHYKGSIWSRVNGLFDQEKTLKNEAFDTFPIYEIYKK